MNKQEEKQEEKKITLPNWAAMLLLTIFIIIIAIVLYLQFTRYKLLGQAINKGDLTSSAMLLSPEISAGISNIISAF